MTISKEELLERIKDLEEEVEILEEALLEVK